MATNSLPIPTITFILLTAILMSLTTTLILADDGCPYPCYPPPIGGTGGGGSGTTSPSPPDTSSSGSSNYPPPATAAGYPPPSSTGELPNYPPPSPGYSGDGSGSSSGYSGSGSGSYGGGAAPPPPDPILPYFPYYFKNGLHGEGSSNSSPLIAGSSRSMMILMCSLIASLFYAWV